MSMKLSNQGLSSREEFKKYIESIGFEYNFPNYYYKQYKVYLYKDFYTFESDSEVLYTIGYNDLTLFRKFDRSYKLKKILG